MQAHTGGLKVFIAAFDVNLGIRLKWLYLHPDSFTCAEMVTI